MPGGLVKAKKYDWTDSNLALFGSDTDKKVKKDSAETEPAWKGAGQEVGIQIWRINKFKVEHWPKEEYGEFYNGDSYIILKTYKEKDGNELNYDLHFWIGSESTQDEYGTAAYKTVELDTLLDDKPVQHREVEKHESPLFKGYFKSLTIKKGGCDTGFNKVKPEEYVPRLLKVSGEKRNVRVTQVGYCKSNITEDDVYIIDKGNDLFLYIGPTSNLMERHKGSEEIQKIKGTRGRAKHMVVESLGHSCFSDFSETPDDEDEADDEPDSSEPSMYKLSDKSGQLEFTEISNEGGLSRSNLSHEDVFILDTTKECFVWIGSGASDAEMGNGMSYAHNYLSNTTHPLLSVSVVKQGKESRAFKAATVA